MDSVLNDSVSNDSVSNPVLPKGLNVCRPGQSLETAASNAGDVSLLATTQGLEVAKGTLGKGFRLHIYPAEGSCRPTEVYYLLHGSLGFDTPEGQQVLGPGAHLVAHDLQAAAVFTALTDIVFLYVTSKPNFHEISNSLETLRELTAKLNQKDAGETEEHCSRMRRLAYAMGCTLGLSQHHLHLLDYAAYFHDIGKIEVPAEILQKPGALNPAEWAVIERHPSYGRALLDHTFIQEASVIVEQHHERLDGSGYPYGLTAPDIAVEASVIAVADAYDAMTSNRPYRPALSRGEALLELQRCAGRHYPQEVVDALVANLDVLV